MNHVLEIAVSRACIFSVVLGLSGCGLLGGNPTQGIGIISKNCPKDPTSSTYAPRCLPGSDLMITPNVPVWGNQIGDCWDPSASTTTTPNCYYPASYSTDYTSGTIESFGNNADPPASTGSNGVLIVNNAKAPALWNLYYLEPWPCGYSASPLNAEGYPVYPVYQGGVPYDSSIWWEEESEGVAVGNYYPNKQVFDLACYVPGPLLPASTRFAILGNIPNTLTLGSAVPLTTQYGMPLLYVYDKAGNIVVTETATSVSSNDTQATFPFPSSLSESGYSVAMVNLTGGDSVPTPAGDNPLSIASSQTVAGAPFGVSVAGITDAYIDINTCVKTDSHNSSAYGTVPIVFALFRKSGISGR